MNIIAKITNNIEIKDVLVSKSNMLKFIIFISIFQSNAFAQKKPSAKIQGFLGKAQSNPPIKFISGNSSTPHDSNTVVIDTTRETWNLFKTEIDLDSLPLNSYGYAYPVHPEKGAIEYDETNLVYSEDGITTKKIFFSNSFKPVIDNRTSADTLVIDFIKK